MHDYLSQFKQEGFFELTNLISSEDALAFRNSILAMRPLGPSLFMTEEEWEQSPKIHERTNPGKGYNIIEKLLYKNPNCLDFIENNERLRQILRPLLGKNFQWLKKKVVYRMPRSSIPEWLRLKLQGRLSNTLNAFVYPQFRDIAYGLEYDFHQDITEWHRMSDEEKNHRIVTLYIHLDDVLKEEDAPLILLPGTHRFGATPYQHNVKYHSDKDSWLYKARDFSYEAKCKKIYGNIGSALIFHSCLLHAAHTIRKGHRLILRYTLVCSEEYCDLDKVNEYIDGPLYTTIDYTPGKRIGKDGLWDLQLSDFIRMNTA